MKFFKTLFNSIDTICGRTLDKFLKKLNVNRNTFFTYILTLISIYICVDRIVEMLLMIFTGISSNYWGPFKYTLALACPTFAFAFFGSSSFANSKGIKVTMFYVYMIAIYIITISMLSQWLNMGLWLLFLSVPNYVYLITNFSGLAHSAFSAIALYIPLVTVYPFIKKILLDIDDSSEKVKSLWDYKGINLSSSATKAGPYACDVKFVKDAYNAKSITFTEKARFSSLFVCGGSGTGKTSLIFEPMIAQDIEKKYFLKEASKELGFTALKTGIATLSAPFSNEYLNKNFTLNMLTPSFGKDTLYRTFMQKMILSSSPEIVYRNLGLTYISPDYDTIANMTKICDNYGINYYLVDPLNPEKSYGLNPFIYDDPAKIAITISSVIHGITTVDGPEMKDSSKEEIYIQILENLSILLKVVYPKMHDGVLPNMEDLLVLLSKFDLVEKMTEILKADPELSKKYQMQISYFYRNFYNNSKGKANTENYTYQLSSKIENLLRIPSIKAILCNRHININFDTALENGDFIFICTRRGESGKNVNKAFGLFFLLSMQNAILRRPGNESNRIPNFLYIDEFPEFLTKETESMFATYRKYKVGTTISSQSIAMLNLNTMGGSPINSAILSNCASKVFTGGAAPTNELDWWQKEIGQWKQWEYKRTFDGSKGVLDPKLGDVGFKTVDKVKAGKLQTLSLKQCAYKIITDSGSPQISEGSIDFVPAKYKEKHSSKNYNFEKFTNGNISENENSSRKKIFNKNSFDDTDGEINPIQENNSKFLIDNEDAIIFNLKNKKSDN